VTAIASEIPQLDPARYHREVNGYVYAADGHTVLEVLRGSENRRVVSSDDIADVVKQAIVAVEDRRFFEHRGVDVRGILRAVWQDVRNQKVVEGGSTITQQFVKNAYVKGERSISRKLREAALAWQLEQRWSKDRILTAYLNTIYFGNGAYGIEQAARVYFGHSAAKLTLPEAALLAGIPADPSLYDPVTNPKAALERRETGLRDMLEQRDITYGQFRQASRTPLPQPEEVRLPGTQGPKAPLYFTNYVKQLLVDRYGTARVFGGGLRVTTSIDIGLQTIAKRAITKWLPSEMGPSAALVAVDPRDGRVLAMVGGDNYRKSQFNLAVQGHRQAGSSFKPFVLATALSQGISPTTTFESGPVTISLGDRLWYVHNYEGQNLGRIDLGTATAYSDNTVYAQLTNVVGPRNVARTARALGITSPLKGYFAIGLGAEAVNPLEMARAFSSIANGGSRIDGSLLGNHPRAILSVNGQDNEVVPHRVLSENNAAIVDYLLERVVAEGTGKRAQLVDGRPVAGKTGTTENYGDAWFVGYTPQLAVAVWTGYPNRLVPMLTDYHGDPVAGGTYPALIWKSFMERALPYLHDGPEGFPSPQFGYASAKRLVLRDGRWELDNGYCRHTIQIAYVSGYRLPKTAGCKLNEVEVPRVVGLTYEAARARLALQPLSAQPIYKPAAAGQRLGVVLGQIPGIGARLSSFDTVRLVLAKPVHGVVPSVLGMPLTGALRKLAPVHAHVVLRKGPRGEGLAGHVMGQSPRPGVAAAPAMRITLVVARGGGRSAGSGSANPPVRTATAARQHG
jgi:penicillin-binding protein 1A